MSKGSEPKSNKGSNQKPRGIVGPIMHHMTTAHLNAVLGVAQGTEQRQLTPSHLAKPLGSNTGGGGSNNQSGSQSTDKK
jgi:hypothetical protein